MANRDIIVSVNVIRRDAGLVVQTQTIKKELPYVQVGNVVTIVGKDGSLIYSAAGVPSNSLGVYTDLYIDTNSPNNFYQKNASNVWVLKGSLKGISGDDGREVLIQNDGTYIQWQYVGDTEWTNIVEVSTLKGDTGANIELNTSATHIQWRVVGDTNWIDLVALVDLKGADGYTPIKGIDYFDGLTPYIGINGNWWIGDVDQNIKAEGVDGISPTIGLNGNWYVGATDTGIKAGGTDGTNGLDGNDGVGISNITKTGTILNVDEYTITFTDASTFLFYVTNGLNGADGTDGLDGTNGTDGRGIVSIIKTSTVGVVDTYTITYSDSTTSTFDVTNGEKGDDGTSAYEIYHTGGGTLSEVDFNASITNIPTHISDTTIHHTIDELDELYDSKLTCVSKTANYTAQPNELVNCDISAGGFIVTLPTAPVDKTRIHVKLNTIGLNQQLTLKTGGTDKFNEPTGNTEIYMYLFGSYAQMQYCAASGLWITFISAGTFNFATQFPGIDAVTPITENDVTFNATTGVLTIVPPLGYFNFYVNGNGIITRYRKVGTVNFPAITDTSGTWYFYFNNLGQPISTQVAWTGADFHTIAPVYRVLWNSTLVGTAKAVSEYIEWHLNTISADDHIWKHAQGSIWLDGLNIFDNFLASGTPNADGRNTCISLSSGVVTDDNLPYTVINDSTPTDFWEQDLGNNTPASLNATNSGLFKIFVQDSGGRASFLPATRFPFAWDTATNRPQFITTTGVRTLVADNRWFVYFLYATQNPKTGEAIRLVSSAAEYSSLSNAQAVTWGTIQSLYPTLFNDTEIRPLYRLIFYNNHLGAFPAGAKYTALRERQDIRKAAVTSTTTAAGSIAASSVTLVPVGNVASTNVQSAIEELDVEKQAALGFTPENVANKENTTIDTSTTKYPTVNLLKTGLDAKMTNPMTAAGDIIYGGTSGAPTRLPKGNDGQVLKLASGLPTWANESGGGDELEFSVTRIENTSGSETLYNTAQRKFYLLDITNAASTYTVTISRKPSSGGTAAFTNVEHYVLIRNTAAASKTLVVQLETTGDKMDSEGLSAVAIPASGIYEVGYIWVARGTDNLCIITKSTLLSEITK